MTACIPMLLTSLVTVLAPGPGEPEALHIGDAAPKLELGPALLGDPLPELPRDHVAVIAVFPTWSVRARENLPCLDPIAKRPDITLVGVCAREIPGETEPQRAFVEALGSQIHFPLHGAPDGGAFEKTWLDRAGCDRLPVAFVIDREGRVAAIAEWGNKHDCDSLVATVDQITKGGWDLAAARRRREFDADPSPHAAELEEWLQAMKAGEAERIFRASDVVLSNNRGLEHVIPEVVRTLAVREDTAVAAYEWATRAARTHAWSNAGALNSLAWFIADSTSALHPDFALAQAASERANELTSQSNGIYLDTLALTCFRRGEVARAVELQRRAVSLSGELRDIGLRQRLEQFENALKGE